MAERAEPRPARPRRADAHAARLAERGPGSGWRMIAAKELADHVSSVRFIVLLVAIAVAALVPLYFTAEVIRSQAESTSGSFGLYLALFTFGPEAIGGLPLITLVATLVPLLGIAFGFDAINSERAQGTLPRLLSQPIHRDDVINGKFVAGIMVISLTLLSMVLIITGMGLARLGIVPEGEELLRIVLWMFATILYASFWLAFAVLLSVVVRRAASAALVGFGAWFGLVLLGSLFIPLLARSLFPISPTADADAQFAAQGAQQAFLRLFPQQLYQDIVRVVLDPTATYALVPGTLGGAQSANEQLPSLLSVDQSILLVWPQIVGLLAVTLVLFAVAYVGFLRQEVRA